MYGLIYNVLLLGRKVVISRNSIKDESSSTNRKYLILPINAVVYLYVAARQN